MNNNPRVSIIIPSYNHEKFIKETIQSIINQDYENIELIIIDDGSKDSSVNAIQEMIPQCEERFARFEFRTRKNKGICFTLNEALDWCEGDFLSGVASDDTIIEYKTSVQVDYLIRNKDSIGVFGGVEFLYEDSGKRVVHVTSASKYNFEEIFMHKHNLPASTSLLRVDAVRKLGGYKEAFLIEDWSLWLFLTENGGTLDYIDMVMGVYRIHKKNISSNLDWMQKGRVEVANLFIEHPLYKKALAQTYVITGLTWGGISVKKKFYHLNKAVKTNYKIIFNISFIIIYVRFLISNLKNYILKQVYKIEN